MREEDIRRIAREEIAKFWLGFGYVVMTGLCVANIIHLYYFVPRLHEIFVDAMPGRPLPRLTLFIVRNRIELVFLTLAWPLVGAYMRRKQSSYGSLWIKVGIITLILQGGITVLVMFTPLIGLITGITDSTSP